MDRERDRASEDERREWAMETCVEKIKKSKGTHIYASRKRKTGIVRRKNCSSGESERKTKYGNAIQKIVKRDKKIETGNEKG